MTRQLKYDQVLLAVMEIISKSQVKPGDRIPPERKLLSQVDCSMITLRRSLTTLAERGILERRRGSGTYLREALGASCHAGKVLYINVNLPGRITAASSFEFEAILSCLHDCGLEMEYLSVHDFSSQIPAAAKKALGILVYGAFTPSFLKGIRALGLPTVLLGGKFLGGKIFPQVAIDAQGITKMLADSFLEKGARRLALLNSDPAYYMSKELEKGFRESLKNSKFGKVTGEVFAIQDSQPDFLYGLFARFHEFDAILMETGIYLRFLAACRTLNCVVPCQVGVVPVTIHAMDQKAQILYHADRHTVIARVDGTIGHAAAAMLCQNIIHNTPLKSHCLTGIIDEGDFASRHQRQQDKKS